MKNLIVLGLALVAAVGCGKKLPKLISPVSPQQPIPSEAPAPEVLPPVKVETLPIVVPTETPAQLEAMKVVLLPQALPNQFFLEVDWKMDRESRGNWFLEKTDSEGTKILCFLGQCPRPFIDKAVLAGESYSYSVTEVNDGERVILGKRTLAVPRDLELKENFNLTEITKVYRLFLRGGIRLTTNGKAAKIEVDELHSENAIIETFPEHSRAADQQVGRSADPIFILSKVATGKLTIKANGEKGGTGLTGNAGFPGQSGMKGQDGETEICPGMQGLHAQKCRDTLARASSHYAPADPLFLGNGWVGCKKQPTAGTNGTAGTPGYPGGQGANGGNAAKLFVAIENPTGFELTSEQVAGAAGDGGLGGTGGAGGIGGDSGAYDTYHACSLAARGTNGASGAQGPTGLSGKPGNSEVGKCVRLGRTVEGNCETF